MNTTGKVLLAGTLGAMAGAALGLLFAPKSGEETRNEIYDKVNDLSDNISDLSKRTKKAVKDMKKNVNEQVKSASNAAKETVKETS